jgi:hypothetical protein
MALNNIVIVGTRSLNRDRRRRRERAGSVKTNEAAERQQAAVRHATETD